MSLKRRIGKLEGAGEPEEPDEELFVIFKFGGETVNFEGKTITRADCEVRLEARRAAAKAAGRKLKVSGFRVVNAPREPLLSEPLTNGKAPG